MYVKVAGNYVCHHNAAKAYYMMSFTMPQKFCNVQPQPSCNDEDIDLPNAPYQNYQGYDDCEVPSFACSAEAITKHRGEKEVQYLGGSTLCLPDDCYYVPARDPLTKAATQG